MTNYSSSTRRPRRPRRLPIVGVIALALVGCDSSGFSNTAADRSAGSADTSAKEAPSLLAVAISVAVEGQSPPPREYATALREALLAQGIDLVDASAKDALARATLSCAEQATDKSYSSGEQGVEIKCTYAIALPGGATHTIRLEERSGSMVTLKRGESLVDATRRELFEAHDFNVLVLLTAVMLGQDYVIPKLLPMLFKVTDRAGITAILKARNYVPPNKRAQAYLALAANDFPACAELGSDAVEPFGEWWDSNTSDLVPEQELAAAQVLVKLVTPETSQTLVNVLLGAVIRNDDATILLLRRLAVVGAKNDATWAAFERKLKYEAPDHPVHKVAKELAEQRFPGRKIAD